MSAFWTRASLRVQILHAATPHWVVRNIIFLDIATV